MLPPIIPVHNPDGTPSDPNKFGILNNTMVNPLTIAANYRATQSNFFLLSNAYVQVDILKGLFFKSSLGANVSDNKYNFFQNQGMTGQALSPVIATNLNSERTVNWLNENTLNYKTVFHNDHKLEVLKGVRCKKSANYEAVGAGANSYSSNLGQTIAFGTVQSGSSASSGNTLLSYLARANYSYKDRYLLTATIRRDGSSRFGADNLWAHFHRSPGAGTSPMKKVHAGREVYRPCKTACELWSTGSNFIGDFTSKASLTAINSSFGNTPVVGFINADPGNPDLSWEKSNQADAGLELGLFNRISRYARLLQ